MNALEIKGAFISLLADVEDTALLKKMFEKCIEVVKGIDMLDDLPPEVINALKETEKDDELADTIPNEEAFKMFRSWPKQ